VSFHRELLDHGYLSVVEHWGSDERIIEAARMSTNKGFLGWEPTADHPGDAKLLGYLYRNNHATPFEMAGLIIEVKAPLMVFREWQRHRTQGYNEQSARYVALPDEDYMPTVDRLMMNGGTNKQARGVGDVVLQEQDALLWLSKLADLYEHSQRVYEAGLEVGVPKELARLAVTVGRYSRMRATCNLRNWLGFLHLRMDLKAQWEIRQYANAVHDALVEKFPRTIALFDEGMSK